MSKQMSTKCWRVHLYICSVFSLLDFSKSSRVAWVLNLHHGISLPFEEPPVRYSTFYVDVVDSGRVREVGQEFIGWMLLI